MLDELHAVVREVRTHLLDPDHLVRASAGGRRKGKTPAWTRVELRPVTVKAGDRLQIVSYDEQQAHTKNVSWGTVAEQAVDTLLAEPFSHWHVATTTQDVAFRVSKSGKVFVTRSEVERDQRREHDRVKSRVLDPADPLLAELGVATSEGKIRVSRKDKYHQIDQFVRLLDASLEDAKAAERLPVDRPIRMVDLGCGNAYLTFAAYRHLTQTRDLSVELVGVDAKSQARTHNEAIAQRLGWAADVRFVEGRIGDVPVPAPVDIVLALHACDTATDDALARAVQWRAPLVLAAPCCHHDLQRQLRTSQPPQPYGLITRHGLLRERFADVLTDSLRAHLMRSRGYRTDVVEFVDTQHTPRNVLLRGHLTGAMPTQEQADEYQRLVDSWQITPRLATLLAQIPG